MGHFTETLNVLCRYKFGGKESICLSRASIQRALKIFISYLTWSLRLRCQKITGKNVIAFVVGPWSGLDVYSFVYTNRFSVVATPGATLAFSLKSICRALELSAASSFFDENLKCLACHITDLRCRWPDSISFQEKGYNRRRKIEHNDAKICLVK